MQQFQQQPMLGLQGPLLQQKHARIFVGDIPPNFSQADVFEVFSKMGMCQVNVFKNSMRLYQSAIIAYDA